VRAAPPAGMILPRGAAGEKDEKGARDAAATAQQPDAAKAEARAADRAHRVHRARHAAAATRTGAARVVTAVDAEPNAAAAMVADLTGPADKRSILERPHRV
jgi:hypothetical protein